MAGSTTLPTSSQRETGIEQRIGSPATETNVLGSQDAISNFVDVGYRIMYAEISNLASMFDNKGALMLNVPRLRSRTLGSDCYETLKKAILNLDILPGTRLIESDLANQLGISKTPVREALARLEGERLIVAGAGRRQNLVSGLSEATIRDLYSVRAIIEPTVLREHSDPINNGDLKQLGQFVSDAEDSAKADGLAGYVAANNGFHMYLIRRSGNRVLISQMQSVFEQIHRVRLALQQTVIRDSHHSVVNEGIESHRKILNGLSNGDIDLAARMLKRDIVLFFDLLGSEVMKPALNILASGPEPDLE